MHIFSMIMIGLGLGFLMLAGLLAHECLAVRAGRVSTPASMLRDVLNRVVRNAMSNYERDVIFGAVVPVVLFMVLPGAAFVNAILGGSPFMITCYLFIVFSVLIHLLFAENPRMESVLALLSGVAAMMATVFLPYYAAWSLTGHILLAPPAHSVVVGPLIAVILYAANAGIWSLLHAPSAGMQETCAEQFMASILLSVPLAYIGYWFGLLLVSLGGGDVASGQVWSVLVFVSLFGGIVFASFKAVLKGGRGFSSVWTGVGIGVLCLGAAMAVK
jgi:hypothetical protein